MRIWQTLTAPFSRYFARLRRVSEQTYCGDTTKCEGLSFERGNLDFQTTPRAVAWDAPDKPAEQGRTPVNYPSS